MTNCDLAFLDPDTSLSVRAFTVKDGMSRLFDVYVTAGTMAPDLDLDAIVGQPAAFRLATGDPDQPYAVWSGVCNEMDQIAVEENGLCIYALRIVPMMWRCTQRRNYRVFQHQSTVEIVVALMSEWGIEVGLKLDDARLPRHEYRVQFGESDFAFVVRLLEADGISYLFEQIDPSGAEKDDEQEREPLPNMRLVLTESPGETGTHLEEGIPHQGHTDDVAGDAPWITKVRFGRAMRAGRFSLGGYDYRSSPELKLLVDARVGSESEQRYELYHYIPGAFLAEPKPANEQPGDDRSRSPGQVLNEDLGRRNAQLGLDRTRTRQQRLSFVTNQLTLQPGVVFNMHGHPRSELADETAILVVARDITGEHDEQWHLTVDAAIAADPFRPALTIPKPRVMGVQSAIVVGHEGEEIHCDALGRVRVQFHWDRYGQQDENSSCWIRVSQGWAGSGYGMHAIPRVGHEVLVDFFEGDPDRPIIVGRAHHRGATPADALPKEKTKTSWKSSSSPGGGGFNEISMDDARGAEQLYFRAQKDHTKIVLESEEAAIGHNLATTIRRNEQRFVGGEQAVDVKGDQKVSVGGIMTARSDRGVQTQAGESTGVSCIDGKLIITNGQASIVLDGPNLYIDAEANLRMSAARLASLNGMQVKIDGRPEVFINSGSYLAPSVSRLAIATKGGSGSFEQDGGGQQPTPEQGQARPEDPGGLEEARFDGKGYLLTQINDQFGTKLKWPKNVRLPPEYDEQLERAGRIAYKGGVVKGKLLDPETYNDINERVQQRFDRERARLEKIGTDFKGIFDRQSTHYSDVASRLGHRLEQERSSLGEFGDEVGAVFRGERGNLVDSSKALFEAFKDQAKNIKKLRDDLKGMLDRELRYFEQAKREWTGYYEQVKGYVGDWKEIIDNPKDAVLDLLIDDELAQDITDLADELGYGDEVADFLGVDNGAGDGAGHGLGDAAGHAPGAGHDHGAGHDARPNFKRKSRSVADPSGGVRRGGQGSNLASANSGARGGSGGAAGRGSNLASLNSGTRGGAGSRGAGGQGSNLASLNSGTRNPNGTGAGVVSRGGGIGAQDVAGAVGTDSPTFLQSPGEGQLLAIPTDGAQPLDSAKLQAMMVDAQMDGQPVSGAISEALNDSGYQVYTRGWGDWVSSFESATGA